MFALAPARAPRREEIIKLEACLRMFYVRSVWTDEFWVKVAHNLDRFGLENEHVHR